MKIIARPMGTNKTKELLELADANDGLVLTCEKHALQVKAEAYGLHNLTIIDWFDLFEGEYPADKHDLYIHKTGATLAEYFTANFDLDLQCMSITMEE